jgi:hypothetical protein
MITDAMFDKTNKYLLHNDPWVLNRLHKFSGNKALREPSQVPTDGEARLKIVFRILLIFLIPILESI